MSNKKWGFGTIKKLWKWSKLSGARTFCQLAEFPKRRKVIIKADEGIVKCNYGSLVTQSQVKSVIFVHPLSGRWNGKLTKDIAGNYIILEKNTFNNKF